MRLLVLLLLVQPCCAQLVLATAFPGNSANYFAPGQLILFAVTGTNDLSNIKLTIAPSTPLPILSSVIPGVGLARLPADLPVGAASAWATMNGTNTPPVSFTVVSSNFGIFTGLISASYRITYLPSGTIEVISSNPGPYFAYKNNGPFVGLAQPAHPGDYLTIYGTGLGSVTPDQVAVSVAGLAVPVTYAGPSPGQPGVDQINVYLPTGLAVPDSCYDAFSVTVAGAAVTPRGLSYTQSANSCPSPFGFNAAELAAIDSGIQVQFIQLALSSAIVPATPTGFTRNEAAQALQLNSSEAITPQRFADNVLYSCEALQTTGAVFSILVGPYQGLALTMGSSSIPIGQPITPPAAVPAPDVPLPSVFQPGTWQLSATGFSQPLQLPPPIQLQNPTAIQSIDTSHDLTVTWNPAGYSKSDLLFLYISASANPFFTSGSVSCGAPAAGGSLTIPAAQLRTIPASANLTALVDTTQTPNFRLPQPNGSTLPLQVTYSFSETFPVTLH